MTEGGATPEIPQHLVESVLSAEAYEQQARRDFQIADYARKLRIPAESMQDNATVYRYVTVLRDAEAAGERLGRYEAIRPIIPDESPLGVRTAQAAHLYRAEKMLLQEGFSPLGNDFETYGIDIDPMRRTMSLTGLLDRAAQPYGLSVDVSEGWREQRRHDISVGKAKSYRPRGEPARGMWTGEPVTTGQLEPWPRAGGDWSGWYWPDWPNERHDREHLQALAEEASRHGIAPDRPRTDPVLHTLLTGLVHGRQLVAETQGLDALPPAPGLTPPAHERLARVAPLNRLAVMVLEDAVRPGSLDRGRFVTELGAVTKPYGLVLAGSNAKR